MEDPSIFDEEDVGVEPLKCIGACLAHSGCFHICIPKLYDVLWVLWNFSCLFNDYKPLARALPVASCWRKITVTLPPSWASREAQGGDKWKSTLKTINVWSCCSSLTKATAVMVSNSFIRWNSKHLKKKKRKIGRNLNLTFPYFCEFGQAYFCKPRHL